MSIINYLQQKQRGVYSEVLNPDNSNSSTNNDSIIQGQYNSIQVFQKQNQPKATRLRSKTSQVPQIQPQTEKNGIKVEPSQPTKIIQNQMNIRKIVLNRPITGMPVIKENKDEDTTIDPKVLEPFEPIPGRVPRKVAIDRKKKEYSSFNLEQLLKYENIDFNKQDPKLQWLPLEIFDDTTYDDYSNEEWIAKQIDEEGKKKKIYAKGLFKDNASGLFSFRNIQILTYNRSNDLFYGRWRDTQQEVKIHRIYFCFDAEDPRKYVKRIVNAFNQRIYADSLIRYNFYIDNMPQQDLSELDTEQKKRLDHLAKTKQLEGAETTPLIIEINNDYARTMNKIIFDKYLEDNSHLQDEIYPRIRLPTKKAQENTPYYGMMPLERQKGVKLIWLENYTGKPTDKIHWEEPKDFTETFKDFCFSSLYIKEEVISALQEIRVECNKVLGMEIFNNEFHQGMVLEEFKHIQESSIASIIYYLRGNWIVELTKIIKNNFNGVGKGWFNMKETSKITYDFGKLKRFLTVVRLMMQDTVLTLVQRCYKKLENVIISYIPKKVIITSPSNSQNIYEEWQMKDGQGPSPLFAIELLKTSNDSDFIYSVKPENFVKMIIQAFEKGLEEIAKIPDLEPKILSDLYKSLKSETNIKAPMKPREKPIDPDPEERPRKYPDENKWIWDMIENIKDKLNMGLQPLQDYMNQFEVFKEVLQMDPQVYIDNIQKEAIPWEVDQLQEEIIRIQKKEERLKKSIPDALQVSFFFIQTQEISAYLCEKYYTLYKSLVDMIAKHARAQAGSLFSQFQNIKNRIREVPNNIEKLAEMTEYMNSIPAELEKIRLEMNKCFDVYKILEGFNFRFSKDDLDKKWIVFGGVKDILGLIKQRQKQLSKDQEVFQEQMKEQQADLKDRIENLAQTISSFHEFNSLASSEEVAQTAIDVNKGLQQFLEDAKKFNYRENLFGMEVTNYDKIGQIAKEFQPYSNLWLTADKWVKYKKSWFKDDFNTLNAVLAERFVEDSSKLLNGVCRFFRERGILPVYNIAAQVKKELDDFKPKVPLMVALRKPGMMQRHWDQISSKVGFEIKYQQDGFNFQKILDLGLMKNVDDIVEIGERASKEYQIETMLTEMESKWQIINFQILVYKTSHIIRGYDEIQIILDEHIVNTQAMQFSPFKKPFEEKIIEWNNTLKTMSDVLEEWAKCQGQWMYLQPIFDSADIAKQLPAETKKFKTVDSTWKHTMITANTLHNVLNVCIQDGLLERLQEANKNLEIIQKELNNYLEKKREKFARFYFLSNDDLLEILSQTKEPTAVQPHLKKVFENMDEIEFKPDKKIVAMFSAEREKVNFVHPVDPVKKNVEDWMGEVETMMQLSIRHALQNSVKDYQAAQRNNWVKNHPGQCVLNGSQMIWTTEVEGCFLKGSKEVKAYFQKQTSQMEGLVQLVRQRLTKQQKTTINALIVIDVHAKDIVEKLVAENVKDVAAFEWISQLRYYSENDEKNELQCFVKCVQTRFPYGYEYLGNTLRLVITPLTDRCYITLMGALNLNLGGAPAGPAGTGKTESVKDMAKALAKQCVVFNCSDSMDYIMVGKFFKGLACAGAWCCFDEFNRINIEVLSVIAQQLLILFGEKAKGSPQVEFEGSNIKIKPTFCVFITMNPGYAGRTELPDNLKALFRPVAMMVPDYALIGEIMLYSFGFSAGRALAKKMVATFQLSSEQLSSQDHYDYGMRAVRSVINAAGLLKGQDPDMDEEQLLLRALRDVNVPKFLKDDLPLFENIIKDLFPGISQPVIDYGKLLRQVNVECKSKNLQPTEPFVSKVIQLYDTIQVRHGLMIVGPTGGGKTRNYQVLQSAMSALVNDGQAKVNVHILNPKSITMGQLYGQFNEQTHEWTDGILAFRVRECCRDQSIEKHWVLFDGPVDSLWIESMNTVLDDNKKLCLNSGQILTLTSNMTMMFEVEDLLVASPATVSRCGMIYMEPESLGIQVLVDSWLATLPPNIAVYKNIRNRVTQLFNLLMKDSLEFLKKFLKEPLPTMNNNLVQSLQKIFDCYLIDFTETELKKIQTEDLQVLEEVIDPLFVFCLIWSVGCTTDEEGRLKFSQWLKQKVVSSGVNANWPDESADVYDYEFKIENKQFIHWNDRNKKFQPDPSLGYHEMMIPTADSTRNLFFLKLFMQNSRHTITPGPTGTGKTQNIFQLLTQDLGENFQYINLTFSAQTSSNQTQDTIDSKLDKRRKGVYGPPIGKKCIIFVDDLNMPKKEIFGAQPPIELLRQYLDHKGWYNRRDLSFMKMEDVIILSAMGPPGGGRTFITNRIIRHFNIIGYTELSDQTINHIFTTLVDNFFKRYNDPVKELNQSLVEGVLFTYNSVKRDLLPTPSKSHYTFNLRDIWKVFQGICSGHPKYTGDPTSMIKLWYHENMRVFYDRLTTESDRTYLANLLQNQIKSQFGLEVESILDCDRILFTDVLNGREADPRYYQQITDLEMFINKMDAFQEDYNSDQTFIYGGPKKPMKLVMFLDACEHISRISRIIRQPQGNALLLGVGGSGRQFLSRMSTFLTNYKLFQIEVIKNYNTRSWRDDIKRVLMYAGTENKPISFLFTDTQIIREQMMEDINNILNSGDVIGIYQEKDYEDIISACKNECIKRSIQPTKINIFTQYLVRVKKNIHMIIAMSPLGNIFTTRLRMFPSLVNCCTIDWFTEWPEEALLGVGKGQLIDYEEELGIIGKTGVMVECFKDIHKSVERLSQSFLSELRRHNYVTPTSYLELLTMFRVILTQKKKEFQLSIQRLKNGLDKLEDANKSVDEMKILLGKMEPELKKASEETEKMLERLKIDKADADLTLKVVSVEEAEASIQEQEARKLGAEAEAAVSEANNQLDITLKEVQKLKKEHLVEIKSLGSPPEAVKVTLGGVVILMSEKIKKNGGEIIMSVKEGQVGGKKEENYFETAKRYLLNDPRELLDMLMSYDKDNINPNIIKNLESKCLSRPEFTFAAVERCSFATKFLFMWVKAMMDYYKVFVETRPLREKLVAMRKIVQEKTAELKIKKDSLEKVNRRIQELQEMFNEKMLQKQQLQEKISECQIKLERAEKLTNGLSEEKERWANDIKSLMGRSDLVPAHSIIAAGMISYSGPFTSQYRQKLEQGWVMNLAQQGLEHDPRVTMRGFLGIPVKIQSWNIAGLPKDDTSTENGLIIDNGRRWPLMIDPQNQANKFVKNLGKDHQEGIEVMKINDPNLMKLMELAVQFGRWVLLENVGIDIDPSLEPILQQQVIKQGSSLSITIGDKTQTYSDKFKLYLTTTMSNPHYPPETFVKVTIINFAITPSGLEEQMLAQIVALENPNLEQRKIEIVKKNAQDQKQLLKIEDDILKSLSDTGDIAEILKDESLINQLQTSKKFAAEINQRVKDSKITEAQIDEARESYRSVAFRSAILFFCIVDLSTIDPMYQYSLQWFTNLFIMGVENSLASNNLEERLNNLNDYFTYSLYENVCRSLFERHKLLFSFMLTIAILKGQNAIDMEEWRYFLTGPQGEIEIKPNPTNWISENSWPQIYRELNGMNQLQCFEGIDDHFMNNSIEFKLIYDSPNAHQEPLPLPWNEKLNIFQKMIFLKMIRPDKVIPAVQNYISEIIGKQFIIVPTFDLAKCFKDSSIITPLIFVLSAGSDPVADFMRFAEEQQMGKRIDSISLGQGQGPKAEKLMKESQQRGGWVLLQNCHLAQSWMLELDRLCEELNENMHKDFRLWLTSMPANYFPVTVLQNGIKMTLEPPQGLRSNLLRTYKAIGEVELNECSKPDQFKKLLFGFALFHAIIQDRRKFGPIGWNIAYEFTNEDFGVCRRQLKMLLDEYNDIPYKVINFLGAEINYGGRVTDDKDVRLIKTILKLYICKDSLKDNYKYSESGIYHSPVVGTLDDYLEYIQSLPLNPSPEAFGLHDNAEITNAQSDTLVMLTTLLSIQPRASSGSGMSREEKIDEIATFVQSRTPEEFDMEDITRRYPTSYEESMNTVLVQELIRYNRLLKVMQVTLLNLKKGLKGLVVLSEELEEVGNSLYDNMVPKSWSDKGFLSLKPLSSWTQDLQERIKFLMDWIENGTPKVYWISGFFFPQAFITGTLQNYARKTSIAIDKLSFEYVVLDSMTHTDIKEKPESGCYVYGLFFEGAKWNSKKHHIAWPDPKELYSDIPLLHFVPQCDRVVPNEGIYNCPLYKVVTRTGILSTTGHSTNFVRFIEFNSNKPEDIWVRAGVAAFLSLRY